MLQEKRDVYKKLRKTIKSSNLQLFRIATIIADRTVERKIAPVNETVFPHAPFACQFLVTIFALIPDRCMIGLLNINLKTLNS
jgi:hypothetical protein